jgi:Winged helix DNA-binding domain
MIADRAVAPRRGDPPADGVLARRLAAQLLSGPAARNPVAVAERLLAVQAQDGRGARLAVRARTEGVSAADVDRALTRERSLVVTWLNRGTLHLVRSEDLPWLHAVTTPPLRTGNARRLAQEGVPPDDADRAVAAVERALADDGPLTREELRERVARTGVRTERQALVHVLMLACLRGIAVRGPIAGGRQAYALVRDWLPPWPAVDRDAALAELARRYLAGHGPAADRDLARWAGLPLRDSRAGLAAIAARLEHRADGLVDLAGRPPAPGLPPPVLLGPFEPVLLGWASREEITGPHAERIAVGGVFRSFALVRGRAAATWAIDAGEVAIEPLGRIARADAAALRVDATDVLRFLG